MFRPLDRVKLKTLPGDGASPVANVASVAKVYPGPPALVGQTAANVAKRPRKTEPALQAPSCSGHLSVEQKTVANVAGVANPDPLGKDHIPRADGVSSDARLKAAPGDNGDTGDTFGFAGSDLLI